MKPLNLAPLLLICMATAFGATGISSYQDLATPSKVKYAIVAWPKGAVDPVRFVSAFYKGDTSAYVRLDDKSILKPDDAKIRLPGDFDSLKAARVPTTWPIPSDKEIRWVPSTVYEGRWIFPRIAGEVTLYSAEPERGIYRHMDTGNGIQPFSGTAVRTKIKADPKAAKFLGHEKIGYNLAWGFAGVGGALAVGGIAANLAGVEAGKANSTALIGIGIAALSWVPHMKVQGLFEEAVRAYNAGVADSVKSTVQP